MFMHIYTVLYYSRYTIYIDIYSIEQVRMMRNDSIVATQQLTDKKKALAGIQIFVISENC